MSTPRVGIGYDSHPLAEGRRLIIGGVHIPFARGLAGHSDSDVLAHAVVDALLGAAALGDIGAKFSPEDPQYKDASSLIFLQSAARLLIEQKWRIGNVDVTIIAQQPKLAPFIPQMRSNVAAALGITLEQLSVKAKSTNGLGFEGRGEGIAAQAVALLERIE